MTIEQIESKMEALRAEDAADKRKMRGPSPSPGVLGTELADAAKVREERRARKDMRRDLEAQLVALRAEKTPRSLDVIDAELAEMNQKADALHAQRKALSAERARAVLAAEFAEMSPEKRAALLAMAKKSTK